MSENSGLVHPAPSANGRSVPIATIPITVVSVSLWRASFITPSKPVPLYQRGDGQPDPEYERERERRDTHGVEKLRTIVAAVTPITSPIPRPE